MRSCQMERDGKPVPYGDLCYLFDKLKLAQQLLSSCVNG